MQEFEAREIKISREEPKKFQVVVAFFFPIDAPGFCQIANFLRHELLELVDHIYWPYLLSEFDVHDGRVRSDVHENGHFEKQRSDLLLILTLYAMMLLARHDSKNGQLCPA